MPEMDWDNNLEEQRLVEYLASQVGARATGRIEDECTRNYPHDVYFVGNLRSQEDISSGQDSPFGELMNKLSPMAYGAEFRVQTEGSTITLNIVMHWACYYRVFPTLHQQRQHQQNFLAAQSSQETTTIGIEQPSKIIIDEVSSPVEIDDSKETGELTEGTPEITESARDRKRSRIPRDSMFIRFRKIICEATGQIVIQRVAAGGWQTDCRTLQEALDQETLRAQQIALSDPERVRTSTAPEARINVPENVLSSDQTYQDFLKSLVTDVVPSWTWRISSGVRISDTGAQNSNNNIVITTEFLNTSPVPRRADGKGASVWNIEPFLFDTKATYRFEGGTALPFELDVAPRSFRYQRDLWGRGFNCGVERQATEDVFSTTYMPMYIQNRYVTSDTPKALFRELAADPIPVLSAVFERMKAYRDVWTQSRQDYISSEDEWEGVFGSDFDRDAQKFAEEIALFRQGCRLIRENADVRLAFQLTNQVFQRMGRHQQPEKRKEAWRLFQLIFLVSQIPGMTALADPNDAGIAEREMVDIIYFPTGGGKTEAYLGVIVFHCFFDRLRGKSAGVTAWTRFPLRLLTLQQTQRVADVIGIAEIVRRERTEEPRLTGDVDGFAVGYFVGEGGSPNELVNPALSTQGNQVQWSKANDPRARQDWKRVIRCPACRTNTITVELDVPRVRLLHKCSNPTCLFPNGEVPIYVVDNEIYRYLPSVMVGTIDKLASIGSQRKLAQVFGQVDGRCKIHGFYKGKCCQKDCEDTRQLQAGVPSGLSGPTLFVQDELHLLKEGLGTFDAHYETFVQQLQHEFGQHDVLKIIASSATIEAFERQVEHLYGRTRNQARIFPGLGPTLRASFYAETLTYPQRIFVGIIPHNKTIFNTILELIEYYHREIQGLQRLPNGYPNPYGGRYTPGTNQWSSLLDFYSTSLTYFLAGRELNSIRTDIEGAVNPSLQQDTLSALDLYELTGSTSTDDVARTLERISTPTDRAVSVLATSMVSHGVDIDRLNSMIFYGMPRQTAEYIQASSRVGRSHVGIVFDCLHPARERDWSHYTYFTKYHEFLGLLVEPVAINRWSTFSIDRTLPGLFMGVLLQVIANLSGESNPNRYYMREFVTRKYLEGKLGPQDFLPMLEKAYLVSNPTIVAETDFKTKLEQRVRQFFDFILESPPDQSFVSEALIPKPMTSLRDIDEAVEIELDSAGTQWAARSR